MTAAQDTSTSTTSRSERRRARTRQAMLDAGQAVISERGLDKLTIASITEAGDVALGSFYNHFADRDDYLKALTEEALTGWLEEVRRVRPRPFENPLERMAVGFFVMMCRAAQDEHLRGFLAEVLARADLPGTQDFATMFEATLGEAHDQGLIVFEDLTLTALLVVGLVRQSLVFIGTPNAPRHNAELLTRSLLRLLGARPSDTEAVIALAHDCDQLDLQR